VKERTYKQLNKVVRKYVKKWKSNLFLGMWTININIKDYIGDDEGNGYTTTAECKSSWKYFTATINFSHIALKETEEKEIEDIVIHELQHIILSEMREPGIDHEERVASHLQMIFSPMDRHIVYLQDKVKEQQARIDALEKTAKVNHDML
jgi:hypothetical protein